MQGNPSKTKRSEKQAETKAWETCWNGRPVTKEHETRKTVKQKRTYQDIMMRWCVKIHFIPLPPKNTTWAFKRLAYMHKNTQNIFTLTRANQPQPLARQAPTAYPVSQAVDCKSTAGKFRSNRPASNQRAQACGGAGARVTPAHSF